MFVIPLKSVGKTTTKTCLFCNFASAVADTPVPVGTPQCVTNATQCEIIMLFSLHGRALVGFCVGIARQGIEKKAFI